MKKKLLTLAVCLCSALSANAATWVAIDSGNDDIQTFIDNDSIKYIAEDVCTYAVLYKKGKDLPKIVYIKSDYKTDRTGIIRAEEFNEEKYNPSYYSKHAKAFMKDIMDNAIFTSAHEYAFQSHYKVTTQTEEQPVKVEEHKKAKAEQPKAEKIKEEKVKAEKIKEQPKEETKVVPVANKVEQNNPQAVAEGLFNAYVEQIKADIFENWKTSKETANTIINLIISVNSDGSYNGYKILDSSSQCEKARRAAVAAVNLTAPFAQFPQHESFVNQTVIIPITFEQKRFKRYVK